MSSIILFIVKITSKYCIFISPRAIFFILCNKFDKTRLFFQKKLYKKRWKNIYQYSIIYRR